MPSSSHVRIHVKKGGLPGYSLSIPRKLRREALDKIIKVQPWSTIVKRLNVLYIYNKNNHPENAMKFRRDMKYVQKKYNKLPKKSTKKSTRKYKMSPKKYTKKSTRKYKMSPKKSTKKSSRKHKMSPKKSSRKHKMSPKKSSRKHKMLMSSRKTYHKIGASQKW